MLKPPLSLAQKKLSAMTQLSHCGEDIDELLAIFRPRKNCWLGVMACFSLLSTQRSRDLYKCFVSCSHMFSEFPIVSHGFRMFHHQMFPIF